MAIPMAQVGFANQPTGFNKSAGTPHDSTLTLRFEQSHDLAHVLHTAGARLRDGVGNECRVLPRPSVLAGILDYRDFVVVCKIVSARIRTGFARLGAASTFC